MPRSLRHDTSRIPNVAPATQRADWLTAPLLFFPHSLSPLQVPDTTPKDPNDVVVSQFERVEGAEAAVSGCLRS